ncbi:serine hydrolase domain-containing protein [Pusillimonas noertemannii]|uniref:CubicO group peptidase (Beta-lactamase class C family) n=1 Tax=Pusillimonas noertemannii TaxID=305977 RepID=A0A2U1CKL9_9BURK|nr:serine hydrolase domain-containing protein [Pusillimonas noertemannii]NYT69074.1 beta-lactamase family protein [Pusillimonas noertemannii]PVY61541.1 CubicO group peptidase (beta-lactamase class C family) [Pusillimonas noertemannii]TFL09490.1 class A beta-lactamase-related serine hydrolase [Pusillimonas noertemannii]
MINENILARGKPAKMEGFCSSEFSPVLDAFRKNFEERREIGAAVTVFHQGVKVVDLWGGFRDLERETAWQEDSISILFSVSKAMSALCIHMLADRGLLDLDAPVEAYWPGFSDSDSRKKTVLVRHILSHNCGMCFNDSAKTDDVFDFEAMRKALTEQMLPWLPGEQPAYNTTNIGYLMGTIILNVTGKSVVEFLKSEVCGPLGVEFYLGLSQQQLDKVATLYPAETANEQYERGQTPGSNIYRAWNAMPKPWNVDVINSERVRTAFLPSFGGHGTARGQATVYALLANEGVLGGVRLLSGAAVERAQTLQWDTEDAILNRPLRMALGFFKNKPGWVPMGPNPEAFGHFGSGGTLAFADRDANLSFACQSNFQCGGQSVGDRTEALVEATYQCGASGVR